MYYTLLFEMVRSRHFRGKYDQLVVDLFGGHLTAIYHEHGSSMRVTLPVVKTMATFGAAHISGN